MSFIGNFAAAQSAKAIGAYNQGVYYQQAAYERKKAAINKKTYDQVTKPLLLRKFNKDYSKLSENEKITFLKKMIFSKKNEIRNFKFRTRFEVYDPEKLRFQN